MKLLGIVATLGYLSGTVSAGWFGPSLTVSSSSNILVPGQTVSVQLAGKTVNNLVQSEMYLRYKLVLKYDDDSSLSAIPNISIRPSSDQTGIVGTLTVPVLIRNAGKAKICFQDSRIVEQQTSSNKGVIECSEYLRIAPRQVQDMGRPIEELLYQKTSHGDFPELPANLKSNRLYRMTSNLKVKGAFTGDQLQVYLKGPRSSVNILLRNAAVEINPSNPRKARVTFVTPHLNPFVDEFSICIRVDPNVPNHGKSDRACSIQLKVAEIGAGGAPIPNRFISPIKEQQYQNMIMSEPDVQVPPHRTVPVPVSTGAQRTGRPVINEMVPERKGNNPSPHRLHEPAMQEITEEWPDMEAAMQQSIRESPNTAPETTAANFGFPDAQDPYVHESIASIGSRINPVERPPARNRRRPVYIDGQEIN